jgi:hypothetical protein
MYKPTSAKPLGPKDSITITHSIASSGTSVTSQTIVIEGRGIDRSVRFTPDTIHVGCTNVGVPRTIEKALVVTNMDASHTVQILKSEADDGSPFTIEGLTQPLELFPLSPRTFSVTFTPDAPGQLTAKAYFYLDMDPETRHEVTIEGTALFVDAHGSGGCAASSAGTGGGVALVLAALLRLLLPRRLQRTAA